MTLQDTPLVSVITPAYNAEKFLGETIQSVQAQTLPHWEMLICDDSSTDGTLKVAKDFARLDSRIRVLELAQNFGRPAKARKKAIMQSRGRFVAFLDADDLWLPEKLERQIEFMKARDAGLSFHQYRRIDTHGHTTGRLIDIPETVDYKTLLKHNIIGCLTAMVDRQKTGHIKTTEGHRDDFYMWLQITKKGFLAHGLKEDLARYRMVPTSMSYNKLTAATRVWEFYRELMGLGRMQSAYNFVHYAFRTLNKHSRF